MFGENFGTLKDSQSRQKTRNFRFFFKSTDLKNQFSKIPILEILKLFKRIYTGLVKSDNSDIGTETGG